MAKPPYLPDRLTVHLRWSTDPEEIGDERDGLWFVTVAGIAQDPLTDGDTLAEACQHAAEVIDLWMDVKSEHGGPP